MISLILAAGGFCCGALFSVQTIPVEQPDAQCFFAEADGRRGGDLIVIDAGDCIFVASRGHSEKVKELVDRLKSNGHTEYV